MSPEPEPFPLEIECQHVKSLLDRGVDFLLIDCRTQEEHESVHLAAARLIPMEQLPNRLDELDAYRDQRIVVHCHFGGRSREVTEWLRRQGFEKAQNMTGGIDAWATSVDSSLPRY